MTNLKIGVSSEMMQNYKQTAIMSPEKKFEALQTDSGNSLLFSIGTDNVFYVTQESIGHDTGWQKTDLSSAIISKSFPGLQNVTCKTFDVDQNVVDGTIGMALVVNNGTSDSLLLCLGNSSTDTSWLANPKWTQYPFDNPTKPVTIAGVFMSETKNNTQYIVADILRDPASAEKLISRYYISPTSTPVWQVHDVTIDLEADTYSSCLGRQYLTNSPHQPTIDGLYTLGQVVGNGQLTFQPLYNVFNPAIPASPARLQLPGGLVGEAMASCRKPDMSTDLYVCSNGGLYYFASSNQNDGATAVLLFQNPIFKGAKTIVASQDDQLTIVWGINSDNQIFYTTCPIGNETSNPTAWSYPLPIVSNVDLFSPYINRVDSSNTFFAVADNTLFKLIKSSTNGTWQQQSITLPSVDQADTQKYPSYTTRLTVTDDSDQPVPNTSITITSDTRTGVYINHLYYVVSPQGIDVNTDEFGTITIVEWVDSLNGTKLNFSGTAMSPVTHNPMDKSFNKLAALNTSTDLKNASYTIDDGKNPPVTQPLVAPNTSAQDLNAVAASNANLSKVYSQLSAPSSGSPVLLAALTVPQKQIQLSGWDAFLVDAGDLFRWLESGIEAIISVVEDIASGIWHFVAEIAGKVFACVLDVVEKVVEAAIWVFDQIKTAVEDIIKFVQYLFSWSDIITTHRVMKNVIIQFTQHNINNLQKYRTDISNAFKSIQSSIDSWAGIPDFDQTPGSTTNYKNQLSGQNDAPANLGAHHFQGNARQASGNVTAASIGSDIFNDLMTLLQNEENTLTGAYNAIKTDIIDQFDTLSLSDIIKKFAAIIADTLLQTAENVILAAIDVFITLVSGTMALLNAPLNIPVISWLYEEITGDQLSFLDLICLVAAIPATILYKIAASVAGQSGAAPFDKNDAFTKGLIGASSFEQMQALFYTGGAPVLRTSSAMVLTEGASVSTTANTPVLDESKLKIFGFVTGLFAFGGSLVLIVTSALQRVLALSPFPIPDNFKKVVALISGIGNVAYVSPNIATFINVATDNWYQQLNNALTGISIIKGFVNIPISVASNPVFGKISAFIESFINLVWNVPVVMNIVDNHSRWNTDYKSLIPESIGNFAFNLGGMGEFIIEITPDIKAKAIESLIQYGLMLVYGICMPIAGGIYEFVPGQKHS